VPSSLLTFCASCLLVVLTEGSRTSLRKQSFVDKSWFLLRLFNSSYPQPEYINHHNPSKTFCTQNFLLTSQPTSFFPASNIQFLVEIMNTTKRPPSQAVYLLPLTDGGAPDVPGTYIYLPPPSDPAYVVRFQIEGTSSICRQGSLWVNIPGKDEDFHRDNYREYKSVILLSALSTLLISSIDLSQTSTAALR